MKYFLIYLFLEVIVSTNIASYVGGILTFVEIILSALLGIFFLVNFKYSLFDYALEFAKGEITQDEFFAKNLTTALGAVLLIIPGYFSDLIGILLIFDIITPILLKIFKFKNINKKDSSDEIIDVEVVSDSKFVEQSKCK